MNRIVRVRWVDASHIDDDMTETKLLSQKPVEFTTVGMVIVDDREKLTIAGTVGHDEGENMYRDSLILPQQYILEVTELQEVPSHAKQEEVAMKYRKVLFVCEGNTCRSAMAEAIFEGMVKSYGQAQSAGICARSAGTSDFGYQEANPGAVEVMSEKGLDITQHRPRHIDQSLADWADLILVMEHRHKQYVLQNFPAAKARVHLLTEFAGEKGEVLDPFDHGIEAYRECRDRLASLIDAIVENIITEKEKLDG